MQSCHITVVFLLSSYLALSSAEDRVGLETIKENNGKNIYLDILSEMDKQQFFNSMLFLYRGCINDSRIEQLFTYPKPKVIGSCIQDFNYHRVFNGELLTVFIADGILDYQLLQTTAGILDYHRQTRIMAVALNIQHQEDLKQEFLQLCENYKMTKVLLMFLQDNEVDALQYYALKPYPQYHWLEQSLANSQETLWYPHHWLNMHNVSLITYTSQDPPGAILYYNGQGQLKTNGYVARLIQLFAEKFNASLQMYEPLRLDKIVNHFELNELTIAGKLDIPMAMRSALIDGEMIRTSAYYELSYPLLIVPCATPLSMHEVFGLLLNWYFFACVLLSSLLLSFAHSLIDYYLDSLLYHLNFVINDRVLPGVLGQSFAPRDSSWRSLKIVYLLVSFVGLNVSTQFSANINTLFTTLPYHDPINSYEDLRHSTAKIILPEVTAKTMIPILPLFGKSLTVVENGTLVYEHIRQFNNSYGYIISSSTWNHFDQRQQFYSQKKFCIVRGVQFIAFMLYCIALPPHSPLKEPLDHFLYRINELGFRQAWQSSTFNDMVKLKNITLIDENPPEDKRVLRVEDYFWIWLIVAIGCSLSGSVFLVELCMAKF
uniref:Ionotropic glutamate receptor C-terminal domain-containing protein n=1 Tax=Stomoxys calcitrans TaxID=35570 RepID=A0A1I8NM87_STOCA